MKKVVDERLFKVNHGILSKGYYVFLLLIMLGAVLKYMIGKREFGCYYLEAAALAGSLGYMLLQGVLGRFSLNRHKDERQRQEEAVFLSRAFKWCFWIYVFGNFYYVFIVRDFTVSAVNIMVWFIADIMVVVCQFKRGVIVPDIVLGRKEKSDEDQFRRLKIGSFVLGIIGGIGMYVGGESVLPASLGKMAGACATIVSYGLFFGFSWYFGMKMLMVWAQRWNDRKLEEKEDEE